MGCFVGIDIGKNKHDYAVVDDTGAKLACGEFSSNTAGFEKLKRILAQHDIEMIGMEATGHYWRNLWHALNHAGYALRLLNPTATVYYRRMGLTRHKTDALDAVCIARYLAIIRPDERGLGIEEQEQLRSLARAQATLAEQVTEAVNRLHKQLDLSFPEYPKLSGRLDSPKSLALLESYPTAQMMGRSRKLAGKQYGRQHHRIGEALAKRLKEAARRSFGCAQTASDALLSRQSISHIQLLQGQAKTLIHEMEALVAEHDQDAANLSKCSWSHLQKSEWMGCNPTSSAFLEWNEEYGGSILRNSSSTMCRSGEVNRRSRLLQVALGIAIKSAAAVIGEVGDIHRFETPKKLTGYIGVHPRFHESGNKTAHPRMSKAGNKRLRRILWQCTIVAMKHNPIIKAHYEKKLAEGKKKMVAIGHCMNKLIHIIWAVLTYQENFDPNGGIRSQMVAQHAA